MRKLLTAAIVAGAVAVAVQPLFAGTYSVTNKSGVTVTRMHIHTLTAFCKNKDWTGTLAADGQMSISTQSGCMADSWEAWDANGKHYGVSSSVGLTKADLTLQTDGTISYSGSIF